MQINHTARCVVPVLSLSVFVRASLSFCLRGLANRVLLGPPARPNFPGMGEKSNESRSPRWAATVW